MIDVEQIRKSAFEALDDAGDWTVRNCHEEMALKRLSGVLGSILLLGERSTDRELRIHRVRSVLKSRLMSAGIPTHLSRLGRGSTESERAGNAETAREAIRDFVCTLTASTCFS